VLLSDKDTPGEQHRIFYLIANCSNSRYLYQNIIYIMVRNIDPLSRMRGSTTINNKIIKSHRVQKPSNNNSTEVVRSTTTKSLKRQGSIGVSATKSKTIASTTTLNESRHNNSPPSMIEKRDDDDDNSLVSIGTFTVGGEDTPRDDTLIDNTNDNFNEDSSSNKRKVRWSTTVNDNLPKTTTGTSTTGCGSILPFPPLCYNDEVSSLSSNVTDGKVITNIYQDIKNKVDNSVQLMNDKLSRLSLSFNNACGNSTIISTGGYNNGLSVVKLGGGDGECTKEINGGYTDNFTTALDDSNNKVLPLNEENDLLLNTDTTTLKQEDNMLQTTTSQYGHYSSSRTRVVTTSAAPMKKKNQLPTARRAVRQVVAPTASHCAKLSSTSTKAKRIINNAKQQQRRRRDIANTSNKRYNTRNVSVKGSSKNVNTSTTVLPTSSSLHPHDDKLNDSTTIPTTSVKEKSSKSKRRSNKKKKLIDKLKKPSLNNVVNILLKSNNVQRMKNRGLISKLCLAYK